MYNTKGENIDDFVIENLSLYHYLLNKRCNGDPNIEDIRESGFLSYINACINFDDSKGIKFSSYLTRVITNIINEYYTRKSNYRYNSHTTSYDRVISEDNKTNMIDTFSYKTNKFSSPIGSSLIEEALEYVDKKYPYQKDIFYDHISGAKQKEIARKNNISPVQVSRIVKKIQKDLNTRFKGESYEN